MEQLNWDSNQKSINQVQEKLNDTHLLCPPSPNTSCPSSPGSQRQVRIKHIYNIVLIIKY